MPRNSRSDGCIPSTAWTNNASFAGAAAQQAGRTITAIVPYTPGSGPDILARTIGEELSRHWGQPVVVDNKPGASGNIGTQVARAAPDGNTVMMTTNPFTNNVSLFKGLDYDPQKSFQPIIQVGLGGLALAPPRTCSAAT